jgi:hypothetical protein
MTASPTYLSLYSKKFAIQAVSIYDKINTMFTGDKINTMLAEDRRETRFLEGEN